MESQNKPHVFSRSLNFIVIEFVVHFFVAALLSFSFLAKLYATDLSQALRDSSWSIFASVIYMLSIISFPLVFGALPFSLISNLSKIKKIRLDATEKVIHMDSDDNTPRGVDIELQNSITEYKNNETDSPHDFLQEILRYESLAKESRQLAKKIFNRSQVYLFTGCVIAFSGLGFFYIQTDWQKHTEYTEKLVAKMNANRQKINDSIEFSKLMREETQTEKLQAEKQGKSFDPKSKISDDTVRRIKMLELKHNLEENTPNDSTPDLIGMLYELAPRMAILLFIEFIALFFLKQHRTAMDEFRYYETISRHREDVLTLLRFTPPLFLKERLRILEQNVFLKKVGALDKDQTTEFIETKKLDKAENEILSKIVELIASMKK